MCEETWWKGIRWEGKGMGWDVMHYGKRDKVVGGSDGRVKGSGERGRQGKEQW